MKIRTKYFLCVTLALILIALPSCSMFWSSNPTYSGGQMLDDELMSSMRSEVLGEKTETSDQGEPGETTGGETEPNKSDEKTESSTSNDETESDDFNEESSTKHEHKETDGTVYWTKNGGVYHLYKDCGYIKSSSEIISGTSEEALATGKSGVCSRCQNRKDKE